MNTHAFANVAGYYIHTCQKMRYKAEYSPSFLLDPATYEFYPFDTVCRAQLDQDDHAIFSATAISSSKTGIVSAAPSQQQHASTAREPGESAEDGDEDSGSDEEEDEDEDEWLSDPPPPGFLAPADLPFDMLKTVYSFESGRVVPLLVSHSY